MSFFNYLIKKLFLDRLSNIKWIVITLWSFFIFYACDTTDSVRPYQEQTFIKLYGGNGSEEGKDLLQLPDGGFVLVGSSTSESYGGKDVYVVRTDKFGDVIWENNFGGMGDDIGSSVILGQNNSLYVCGEITQDNSLLGKLRDVYVLNISIDNGSLIGGGKQYGENIRDEFGTDIIELSNGGFFISSTMLHSDTSKFYLSETDINLDTLQNRSRYIGTEKVNNYSTSSFENKNDVINPFVCFGSVLRTVNQKNSFWFRSFLYRSNSDGVVYPEFYGTQENDEFCTDIHQTTDGGHILSGFMDNGNSTMEMIVKINPSRKEVWKKVYSNEFNKNIKESRIIQTKDGGFIVSSTIELDDPKNDEISLLKLDFEGEVEWRKTYGSNDDDMGSKVIQLEDGSYAVVGTIGFEINPDSRSKMCLMKLNSNGELVPLN